MSGPINIAQVQRGHEFFLKQQDGWLREALEIAKEQARLHVQRRSTFKRRSARSLKDSTKGRIVKVGGGRKLKLTWTKKRGKWDIAELIEYGTRRHPIEAKYKTVSYKIGYATVRHSRKGMLRFFWKKGPEGPMIYNFPRVMHPGTRPYQFGWRALHAAHRVMSKRLDERVRKARFRF